jgi:hypothetical protein
MSDDEEPVTPRASWLDDVSRELRAEVAVRTAWRSRVITEVAALPRPRRAGHFERQFNGRPIILRPITALAAGLALTLLGAGVATTVLARREGAPIAAATDRPTVGTLVEPAVLRQEVRFVLAAPTASRVSLVGDFNRWNPASLPLTRDPANGTWSVSVSLPPGRHVYAFVVDGDLRADPSAPRAAEEDFGKPNSVVVVNGPTT